MPMYLKKKIHKLSIKHGSMGQIFFLLFFFYYNLGKGIYINCISIYKIESQTIFHPFVKEIPKLHKHFSFHLINNIPHSHFIFVVVHYHSLYIFILYVCVYVSIYDLILFVLFYIYSLTP